MTVSYRQMTGPNGLIANRAEFTGNSMRAEWTTFCPSAGRLDNAEYDVLHNAWKWAFDLGLPMYVVYSYSTPIAWAIKGRDAYCVEQKFSVTTSKGQGYVRAWINSSVPTWDKEAV